MTTSESHLSIDHIGYAVRNIDESIAEYQRLFGLQVQHREMLGKVEVCFLALDNTRIELVACDDPAHTIARYVDKHGPGLHHLCYRVENIIEELARFKGMGLKLIDEEPRLGAHETKIAFLHPEGFGGILTELCEYPAIAR